jgi:hypothetical protein
MIVVQNINKKWITIQNFLFMNYMKSIGDNNRR